MNFDDAVQSHAAWKLKLSTYLRRPDGSLRATEVGRDDACALGCWLHKEGLKYAAIPEFGRLKQEHARFHRAASQVVRRADSGDRVSEDIALGSRSEYASASGAVVQALVAMKRKVA